MRGRRRIPLFLMAMLAVSSQVSGCTGAFSEASAAAGEGDQRSEPVEPQGALARAANVALGTGPTTVTLDGGEISSRLDALGARRLSLVLRGLRATGQPGVLYHLYLNLPAGAGPAGDDPRHVGVINFYAAEAARDPDQIFYSFDVTDVVRTLRARGLLGDPITVTFHPAGAPEPGAKAVVSGIELVAE